MAAACRVPNAVSSPSSEACGVGSFRPDAASIRRYNTHHVYDQPAARL